jgi:hypothetical protein
MAARTVPIRRRALSEEPEPETGPRAPSEEERNRTARRTTEARAEQNSPGMVLAGVAVLLGAVVGVAAVAYTVALAFGAWAWIARPLIDAIGG